MELPQTEIIFDRPLLFLVAIIRLPTFPTVYNGEESLVFLLLFRVVVLQFISF